jgi:hypothetical protein
MTRLVSKRVASTDPQQRRRRVSTVLTLVALAGGFLMILAWMLLDSRRQTRAIRSLPPEARQSVYQRALANYRILCTPVPKTQLTERCQQDAAFLSLFPECDAGCRALLADALPQATR